MQSSLNLEWTWRAHAGHFPIVESYPYIYLIWEWKWVTTRVPIRGPAGRGDRPRYRTVTRLVRTPRWVTDLKPWVVNGTHYELRGLATVVNNSSATGCNWHHTFRPMY